MTLEYKVVITVAIVVDVDAAEAGHSPRMEVVSQRLREVVAQAFAADPTIDPVGGIAYDWLNDPDSNFGRCEQCRRLVSDYEKPDPIRVLVEARVTNGKLLCDECASFCCKDC